MWLTSESEDEYVVRGVPVFFWLVAAVLIGVGSWMLARTGPDDSLDLVLVLAAVFFLPALAILPFAPLIVSKFNRRNKVLGYSRYGLLGIRRHQFRYSELKGGMRVAADEHEEGGLVYTAYFELKSGERIKMCAEPGQWQGWNYDVAMKANEFMRPKEPGGKGSAATK